MLIGIDASRAIRPIQTGTETYSRELIAALLRLESPHRYNIYFDRSPGALFADSGRAERVVIPLRRGWTHLRLGHELRRRPPDVLFVPSHVIPVGCPVPAVVTIHDVGYLWNRSAYRPLAWVLLHLGTLWNARASRLIVADSRATADDLVAHFQVPPEKIRVAYLGGPALESVASDPAVQERFGLPRRYFIFVGTIQPRKNLGRLLRAFAGVRRWTDPDVGLVLVGNPGPSATNLRQLAKMLGIDDHVFWTGYISEHERKVLVAGAVAFVFPSLYEGFGMPVLEAMALGVPVVASSSSSLPEVVGDAGLLVDPYDEDALAGSLAHLLVDNALRESLIERGRWRAPTFTWDRCARDVADTFDAALA